MKLRDGLGLSAGVMRALATGRRVPLIVSWNVTYRCNQSCSYCGSCREEVRDAGTAQVLDIIDRLARLGTRFLGLSGGEPLMRKDIGQIIDACADRDIRVLLKSNGQLVPHRIDEIGRASEVQISLDGPREVHEAVRGAGTYDRVLEAVDLCVERGTSVCLAGVLSRRSLPHLDELLGVVEAHETGIYFQPVDSTFTPDHTDQADYFPEVSAYRAAVDRLIAQKKAGRTSILNSPGGLAHLRRWPEIPSVRCVASRFMCAIEPDGSLFVCDMFPRFEDYTVQPPEGRFEETLRALELPHPCPACPTGATSELNLAANGDVRALWGMLRRVLAQR